MEMPNEVNDEDLRKIRERKNRLYEANKLAARYFFDCLMDPELGKLGRDYAAKRGLSSEIITRFGIFRCCSFNIIFDFFGIIIHIS